MFGNLGVCVVVCRMALVLFTLFMFTCEQWFPLCLDYMGSMAGVLQEAGTDYIFSSNITISYKLYCSICRSWKLRCNLRCYCFNMWHYCSGYSKVYYHSFYYFIIFFNIFSEQQILKQMIRGDISTMKTMLTIYFPSGRVLPLLQVSPWNPNTGNPALRGHLWDKEEGAL